MPSIQSRPLSLPELAAVYLDVFTRRVDPPSFEDIVKSYEKFIPGAIAQLMKNLRGHFPDGGWIGAN